MEQLIGNLEQFGEHLRQAYMFFQFAAVRSPPKSQNYGYNLPSPFKKTGRENVLNFPSCAAASRYEYIRGLVQG